MKATLIIILLFLVRVGWATIFHVYPSENFLLDKIIIEASAGDTILIHQGKYIIPNVSINKPLVIIGEGNPIWKSADGGEILTVTSSGVTIKGVSFTGVVTNYLKENAAIRIKGAKNFNITNNTFQDCFYAVYLEKAKNGQVSQNNIIGNATSEAESGNGIHAWYCKNLLIQNNHIQYHRDGIYLEFVDSSLVTNNISQENTRYGLHYMFSNDDEYIENTFRNNGVGVAVMFSRRIKMTNNRFHKNWGHAAYGLLLKEIYDADIMNNSFEENTIGIFVEGSNRINYKANIFRKNGWAIKFSGGCDQNVISGNDFLHNSIDLIVASQLNNNIIQGNFWSQYKGYDLNQDEIGDIPYYPVKLYSYIIEQVPEGVVLMRSLFIDIINYAEKISPVFTPKDVKDSQPKMHPQT